jgi:hypothetical protein
MTALLGIYVLSRKRLANLPRLIASNPYVTFAVTALFLAGLAYTSLANLGVLTRQKSLVMPFLLLLPCLPERTWRPQTRSDERYDQPAKSMPTSSLSPQSVRPHGVQVAGTANPLDRVAPAQGTSAGANDRQ